MEPTKKSPARIIRTPVQWRALLAKFACGSMNVQSFCQAEKISSSAFYHWRDVLGCAATSPSSSSTASTTGFVDLGALTTPTTTPDPRIELRIDLGNGVTLTLMRH